MKAVESPVPSAKKKQNAAPEADASVRTAILEAAVKAIEESGLASVSMRDVARRAGVSHQLPYHYFVDREGILAAVAEDGFALLTERMKTSYMSAGSAPARISAAGRAYVEFACAHPAHFRLMFRQDFVNLKDHPEAEARAESCFAWVPQLIAECVAEGLPALPNEEALAILGWSMAHGLACLLLDGPLAKKLPDAAEAKEQTISDVMDAMRLLLERSTRRTKAAK